MAVGEQSNYAAWLGADSATDAVQTKAGFGATAVDWLIVDHYAIDARWERAMRSTCRKLMVIDDLADRIHHCDILLDQNFGRKVQAYRGLVPDSCTVLAGSQYALLRPEFAAFRKGSLCRRTAPQLKHLLITMGGVDQSDATGKVLAALHFCILPEDLSITVVMGQHAPWLERVRLGAKQMPRPTVVKIDVNNMAQLMASSDLAIGAAGSTSWERCCLGLPSIICVQAENQKSIASTLELTGAAKAFGIDECVQRLRDLFGEVRNDHRRLQKMSESASSITDGKGVARVSEELRAMTLA
jgi:UDP-2,4-diacetamido-2,4,6-trideoxy-beta-L-altropyranose hydrolase